MEPVKINDLVRAVNGRAASFGERTFQDVSTDSRTVREGEVFFAIAGERLNGHAYGSSALERGAAAAVVAEGEVAFALAQAYLEKFGADNMTDIKAAIKAY